MGNFQTSIKRLFATRATSLFPVLGLLLLSVLVFFYAAFSYSSEFAKTVLIIPGLHLPLFIGEVFLLCCGLLALLYVLEHGLSPSARLYALLVYGAWVAVKMCIGFQHGGVFALRNAALFYYPLTAVFVYYFILCLKNNSVSPYFVDVRGPWAQTALFLIATALFLPSSSLNIFPFAQYCILLALGMIIFYVQEPVFRILSIIYFGIVAVNSSVFVCVSRSHLVAVVMAFVFLGWYFLAVYGTSLKKFKWVFIAGPLVLIGMVMLVSDRNAIRSMGSPFKIVDLYVDLDAQAQQRLKHYKPRGLDVCAYVEATANYKGGEPRNYCSPADTSEAADESAPFTTVNVSEEKELRTFDRTRRTRTLGTAYTNVLFRAFIWRDMWEEIAKEKPFFGFGFEKPQRSKSLEVLNWAEDSWQKDGWIAPHNSFFHLIYRGGIVGVILIWCFIASMIGMTRTFLRERSVLGGLLMSALIFGTMSAMFLLFWELPYMAIPFWYVFGVTAGYEQWLKSRQGRLA